MTDLNFGSDNYRFSESYRPWRSLSRGESTNAILKSWVDAHMKFLN